MYHRTSLFYLILHIEREKTRKFLKLFQYIYHNHTPETETVPRERPDEPVLSANTGTQAFERNSCAYFVRTRGSLGYAHGSCHRDCGDKTDSS